MGLDETSVIGAAMPKILKGLWRGIVLGPDLQVKLTQPFAWNSWDKSTRNLIPSQCDTTGKASAGLIRWPTADDQFTTAASFETQIRLQHLICSETMCMQHTGTLSPL